MTPTSSAGQPRSKCAKTITARLNAVLWLAMVSVQEANQTQVVRILQSKSFRTSEVHRNLLQYLADKSLAGDGDGLKEYVIGLDVFAKPESYDPRQESVVRMHVARLRQKLAEYYRLEGKDDPIFIDVPKGGFKVTFEPRSVPFEPVVAVIAENPVVAKSWRLENVLKVLLAAAILCILIFGLILWRSKGAAISHAETAAPTGIGDLPTELQQLWGPILQTNRPLMVCLTSSEGAAETGTATASFLLGQFLSNRKDNILLTRSEWLSMPELLMDNVVVLGPGSENRAIQAVWSTREFVWERDGVRILHPKAGEPQFIPDPPKGAGAGSETYQSLALISHLPGLYQKGDVLYLAGNEISSMLAAVKAVTDPMLARQLVAKLKGPDGHVPRFYQAVLQVRSMDSMPIDISFPFHRELVAQNQKPTP
jgi:hypothetical protein